MGGEPRFPRRAHLRNSHSHPAGARLNSELTTRAIVVFATLQALDVITTLLGWRLGAHEANIIVARFMKLGPISGLLLAKLLGFVLIVAVFLRGKVRLVKLLNLWFAGIVTWNLVVLWIQWWTVRPQ